MSKKSLIFYIFLTVVLVGTLLRFGNAELTRFGKEPVKDLVVATRILQGEPIFHGVFGGLESTRQVTLGPTYYYIIALSLLFPRVPYFIPLFPIYAIALLNIIAAIVCYRLGKEFFSEFVGFVAAAHFLLAPWNIIHVATILTPPNLLPLATVALLYCLLKVVVKNENRYIIPAGALLSLITQFHLVAIVMAVPVVLTIAIHKRSIEKKYVMLALGVGLLVATPYLAYSIATKNTETITYLLARDESVYSRAIAEAIGIPIAMMTPYIGKYMLGEGISIFEHKLFDWAFLIITIIIVIIFVVGLVYTIRRSFTEKQKSRYSTLAIWLLAPITLLAIPGKNLSPHYFIMLYPAQFLIEAIILEKFREKQKVVVSVLVAIMLIASVFFTYSFYRYVEESGGTKGLYESPYKFKMQVVDYIKQDSQGKPVKIIFYKYPKTAFEYLFTLHSVPAVFGTVNLLDEFTGDYLIIDRYSLYSAGEKELTAREHALLDQADKITIKHFEIIKQLKNEKQ